MGLLCEIMKWSKESLIFIFISVGSFVYQQSKLFMPKSNEQLTGFETMYFFWFRSGSFFEVII